MVEHLSFNLRFATSHKGDDLRVRFDGRADDLAHAAILDGFAQMGSDEDGVSGFSLSPADAFDYDDGIYDSQFLALEGNETLRELRFLVGPDDNAVYLRRSGWGGPDLPEMYNWVISDLLPYGQAFLEVYGAVEFMRVVGRTIEAKKNRELRREAEYWVRSGQDEVHGLLLEAVMRYDSWPVKELDRAFNLPQSDAARLMKACGYDYDVASETYYRLPAYPGLFS
nr:hypothetical protein [Microbacterium testaceum]